MYAYDHTFELHKRLNCLKWGSPMWNFELGYRLFMFPKHAPCHPLTSKEAFPPCFKLSKGIDFGSSLETLLLAFSCFLGWLLNHLFLCYVHGHMLPADWNMLFHLEFSLHDAACYNYKYSTSQVLPIGFAELSLNLTHI